jgi:hypothetical protein
MIHLIKMFVLSFIVWGYPHDLVNLSVPNAATEICNISTDSLEVVPGEAGQLLYVDGILERQTVLRSTSETFASIEVSNSWISLSPDGYWAAWHDWDQNSDLVVHAVTGEQQYRVSVVPPGWRTTLGTPMWLNNEEILSDTPTPFAFPHSITNPFTGEVRFVMPFADAGSYDAEGNFVQEFETDPLLPFWEGDPFRISPDGRYALYYHTWTDHRVIYDIVEKTEIRRFELILRPRGISAQLHWLPNSRQILYSGSPDNFESYALYIYDFEEDTHTQIADVFPEHISIGWEANWSPNEEYFAYGIDVPTESPRIFQLQILNLDTSEITSLCFTGDRGHEFDFAWSRDSRYLAFRGTPIGEDLTEVRGIHVYDTEEEIIYQVYEGGITSIVGWAVDPDT